VTADAQKLKDLLYSGKMKSDSGTTVRKTDDLSTKIDTTVKKPVEPKKPEVITGDLVPNILPEGGEKQKEEPRTVTETNRDNNKVWGAFIDSLVSTLKSEVLSSKKIRKGSYNVLADYEIGLDGTVTIKNVFVTPESDWLHLQVKERLGISTPKLNPVMGSNGKPRKVNKRHSFTVVKE
jgi:hypothetical protein